MDPNVLTLYNPLMNKIRLGKDNDGGYIICEMPNINYNILISGGIDNDVSFEESFISKYKTKCIAFDGTINNILTENPKIIFVKKNIGSCNNDYVTNLHELLISHENIFIKMDIEGAEFDWLLSINDNMFDNIIQMVIEFHFPKSERETEVFNKINKYFYLVHYHANNFCGYEIQNKVSIPNVFECTYVNKKYLKNVELNTNNLPTPLDMVNVKEYPDYFIDYPPFVHQKQ